MTGGDDSAKISATAGSLRAAPAANPAALTAEQLARLLDVSVEKVRGHVAAGAPAAAEGTINLVHYTAWLNRQLAGSDGD